MASREHFDWTLMDSRETPACENLNPAKFPYPDKPSEPGDGEALSAVAPADDDVSVIEDPPVSSPMGQCDGEAVSAAAPAEEVKDEEVNTKGRRRISA